MLVALAAAAILGAPAASAFALDHVTFDGETVYVAAIGERYESVINRQVRLNDDGSRGAKFMFTAAEGTCVLIRMDSSDFAPYLWLTRGTPDGQEIARADSRGGRTAQLRVRLPATGNYFAEATSSGPGEKLGRYTLSLDRC
jgi:hypothetical protein